jgi:hypothetical protein
MYLIEEIFQNFEKIHISEMIRNKDPLMKKRREFKFLVKREFVPKIAEFLSQNFTLSTHSDGILFSYKNDYFDTDDYVFFNKHRCGKPNRLKVRVRKYESGDKKNFMEFKQKIKGVFTEKERFEISEKTEEILIFDNEKTLKILEKFRIKKEEISRKITTTYKRIFLVSKDLKTRITFDLDLSAQFKNGKKVELFQEYFIMEIKDLNTPKNIMQFLKKNFKIRQTNFSKYCISLCALNQDFKSNKWKQILKLNTEDT